MKPTQHSACMAFLTKALDHPIAIELSSPQKARAYRFTCYDIRRALRLTGDPKFDVLRLTISGSVLTARRKDENKDQGNG